MQEATASQLVRLYGNLIITTAPDRSLDVSALHNWISQQYPDVSSHIHIVQRHTGHALIATRQRASPLCTSYTLLTDPDPLVGHYTPETINTSVAAPNDVMPLTIGACLAHDLKLAIGDSVDVWYTVHQELSSYVQSSQPLPIVQSRGVIAQIIATGLDEIDQQGIIMHRPVATDDNPVTYLYTDVPLPASCKTALQDALAGTARVQDWPDLFPALASGMALERQATRWVLALIWLIILVTFGALVLLLLVRKRTALIFLRLYHAPAPVLGSALAYAVGLLSIASVAIGSVLAYILAYILTTYKIISLPNCYYQSYISIVPNTYTPLALLISLMVLLAVLVGTYTHYLYRQQLTSLMADEGML
jgi:ABC-type lipoprotein release transport system permease subunit